MWPYPSLASWGDICRTALSSSLDLSIAPCCSMDSRTDTLTGDTTTLPDWPNNNAYGVIRSTPIIHNYFGYLYHNKSNSKVVPVHAMKSYRGSGNIAPHILKRDTRLRWVVSFRVALPQWKEIQVAPRGVPSLSGDFWEEKNMFSL
jgi:hypothetical protein